MTTERIKRWYVVHVYSGFENYVVNALRQRIKMHGVEACFGEIIVPTEEVVEMRGGQKRKSERKFFPGYVLVQMEMDEKTWHLVKSVPRVLGFIGGTAIVLHRLVIKKLLPFYGELKKANPSRNPKSF